MLESNWQMMKNCNLDCADDLVCPSESTEHAHRALDSVAKACTPRLYCNTMGGQFQTRWRGTNY